MIFSTSALLSLAILTAQSVTARPGPSPVQAADNPHETTITGNDITSDLLPAAINTVCLGGKAGTAKAITLNFDTGIKTTVGDCPTMPGDLVSRETDNVLESRGGCNYPPNMCSWLPGGSNLLGFSRCGAECDSDCYWGDGGPDPNHCEAMFNNFNNRGDQVFSLGHNKFILFTYGTCGTGIQNQIPNTSSGCAVDMLYDYRDWAAVGHYLAWSCQGSQGARGGKCQSTNQDFYMQVYKN